MSQASDTIRNPFNSRLIRPWLLWLGMALSTIASVGDWASQDVRRAIAIGGGLLIGSSIRYKAVLQGPATRFGFLAVLSLGMGMAAVFVLVRGWPL